MSFLSQGPINLANTLIRQRVQSLTGSKGSTKDFEFPRGDPGLFGPRSVAWEVHGHFTAMMVGGLASLLVQSLHPRALAAVWDHSDFRNQLKNRLGRTAYFVATTTYGGKSMALNAIEHVNAIHAQIKGHDLNGQTYVANDPHLLRWVHMVEVTMFICAYQHFALRPLNLTQTNQYIKEMSRIASLLGTGDMPQTWDDTMDALEKYRSELVFDDRAKAIYQIIHRFPVDHWDRPFMCLALNSAFDIMPEWARQKMNRPAHRHWQVQAIRWALMAASEPVQRVLSREGVRAVAERRVAGG